MTIGYNHDRIEKNDKGPGQTLEGFIDGRAAI